jgi:hypothetical protein
MADRLPVRTAPVLAEQVTRFYIDRAGLHFAIQHSAQQGNVKRPYMVNRKDRREWPLPAQIRYR